MNQHGSNWIRRFRRERLYQRDGYRCIYCGMDLEHAKPRDRTLDHVIPRRAGWDNGDRNLVVACRWCNDKKGDRDPLEYIMSLRDGPAVLARVTERTGRSLEPIEF